jgi:hypothetical protein
MLLNHVLEKYKMEYINTLESLMKQMYICIKEYQVPHQKATILKNKNQNLSIQYKTNNPSRASIFNINILKYYASTTDYITSQP